MLPFCRIPYWHFAPHSVEKCCHFAWSKMAVRYSAECGTLQNLHFGAKCKMANLAIAISYFFSHYHPLRGCPSCARLCKAVQGCAMMCKSVQGCARMCKDVQGCARLCKAVQGFARLCKAVQGCARLCKAVQGCARLCKAVHNVKFRPLSLSRTRLFNMVWFCLTRLPWE